MVLTELKKGENAVIQDFGNAELEWMLTDMGCPMGTSIQLYHKSPNGGLISIKTISGNLLAIRTIEAEQLIITKQ